MQDFLADFSMLLLGVISALLILVVLLQRGRGGGLAGAFGGLGGQSAFGTKAGDVFTKITIGLVTAWVLLAGVSGVLARKASEKGDFSDDTPAEVSTEDGGAGSMSAIGDSGSEDSDDATDGSSDDDADTDDSSASETDDTDNEAAASSEKDSSTDSEAASSDATSTDEKADSEPAPAESETATPGDSE